MKLVLNLIILSTLFASCGKNYNNQSIEVNSSNIIGGKLEKSKLLLDNIVHIKLQDTSICSGTYVGNNTFITAAHCIQKPYKVIRNYIALSNTKASEYCEVYGQIANYMFNRDTVRLMTFSNDIAMMRISPECFKLFEPTLTPFIINKNVNLQMEFASGYGNINYGSNNNEPYPLKTLELKGLKKLTTLEDFQKLDMKNDLSPVDYQTWLKTMVADTNQGLKTCYFTNSNYDTLYLGDSGGPGYTFDKNGKPILIGVFSSMYLNNTTKKVEAFCLTNVAKYIDWMEKYKMYLDSVIW